MAKDIIGIEAGSYAQKAGIRAGDRLVSVNGHAVADVLDYKFYAYDRLLQLKISRNGKAMDMTIAKPEGADLGLEFESYLMDEQKGCANKCVFCFIDQLPRGMRKTLYFKDDDARLSFLIGNYITMTNLSDEDVERIIRMRVSPLNISVHTTNPQLRALMLGNRQGGESLRHLHRLAAAGTVINAQIVVCPGLNDGEELESTLRELASMHPSVNSVAVVPVGLTKHRRGLYPLQPMDDASARACIEIIDKIRAENIRLYGRPLCCAADEMYLKAGMQLPDFEYYGGFDQLENGVGLMRLFEQELSGALGAEDRLEPPGPAGVICGMASAGFMGCMIDLMRQKCDNLDCTVFPIRNDFFGDTVDVSGLVTGGDIIGQLEGRALPPRLIIPDCMLRHGETVFLDDISLEEIEGRLGVKIQVAPVGGGAFLDAIFML